ncbi:phosphoesterase [Agromyces fucosus]|uniref:Phosphoesterase n=1 Tax=Agromyces fucosus TaxID=41985 RepID=A0A4Q2JNP4_9MICO|nr:chitobiase/beta-hexosaminidase C-terminal domain-containing protein [Agromyces fucosus]RXZ48634.1 phosphoesterase [Agromyces fucosus]
MPFSRKPAVALPGAVAVTVAAVIAAAGAAAPVAHATDDLAAPTFSVDGGRHVGPTTVELSAPAGADIRYTLDGSMPTLTSPRYEEPITIEESANLSAVSVLGGEVSAAEIEGYLIKSEEPLLSFVVMSDIETTSYDEASRARWDHYFDTITSIQAAPDLILSNGDQIADNNYNTGPHHQVIRSLLSDGLTSHGLDDTKMLVTFGNHDDRLNVMSQYYPTEWFPHTGGGYYEQVVEGHHFLILNTEAYDATQRAWLQGRLAAIAAEPGALNRPVFVVGHRPTPGTVNDGAQATNPAIAADLAAYPQSVFISGHSHLNVNSEKSIHQKDFTAVNDGSMSYSQIPRDAYQNYGPHLIDNFTLPVPQAIFIEVYADRTEIDRIAFSAEPRRTYDANGGWAPYPPTVPTPSAGALAGPTWTVRLDGATAAEVKANFDYTDAVRADRTAPVLGDEPSVRSTATGSVLRVPRASDDEQVSGYDITVTDVATGAAALPFRAGAKVSSDFFFAPMPSVLEIPLAIKQGLQPASPVVSLTNGRAYTATVTAVDGWGNRSATTSVDFVAGFDGVPVEAEARCLGSKAYVTVKAANDEADAVALAISTVYGEKSFANVIAGKSSVHSFPVRAASAPAGAVTVQATRVIGGTPVTVATTAPYDAATCE